MAMLRKQCERKAYADDSLFKTGCVYIEESDSGFQRIKETITESNSKF